MDFPLRKWNIALPMSYHGFLPTKNTSLLRATQDHRSDTETPQQAGRAARPETAQMLRPQIGDLNIWVIICVWYILQYMIYLWYYIISHGCPDDFQISNGCFFHIQPCRCHQLGFPATLHCASGSSPSTSKHIPGLPMARISGPLCISMGPCVSLSRSV